MYRNFLYILEDANRRGVATPSTAFCSPAPGRCLQILRNDSQPSPSGMFLTFDGILSSNSTSKVNPYERHSSRNLISQGNATQLIKGSGEGKEGGKRQWRFFKSVVSTSNSFRDRTKTRSSSPPISRSSSPRRGGPVETSTLHSRPEGSKNFAHDVIEPVPPYRSLSFKFSLEWIDRDNNPAVREGRLGPPKLPLPAQLFLQRGSSQAEIQDNTPRKPEGAAIGPSKYAGRALAEWALLITECQNFFETRKAEGVPSYHLVETPTLGVGPFRKI